MKGFSPKFPLEKGNLVGAYLLNTTFKEVLKQNFKNLLLTTQGERVMDIDFGVGIRSYFFEPKTSITMGVIAEKIQDQAKNICHLFRLIKLIFPEHRMIIFLELR
jgi:hypothetical protein